MTSDATRQARIVTVHGDAEAARQIADALRPDNTREMRTTVEGTTVETTIERESTGGLRSTADDYLVNLRVAARLADGAAHGTTDADDIHDADDTHDT